MITNNQTGSGSSSSHLIHQLSSPTIDTFHGRLSRSSPSGRNGSASAALYANGNGSSEYPCSKCKSSFPTRDQLRDHEVLHSLAVSSVDYATSSDSLYFSETGPDERGNPDPGGSWSRGRSTRSPPEIQVSRMRESIQIQASPEGTYSNSFGRKAVRVSKLFQEILPFGILLISHDFKEVSHYQC